MATPETHPRSSSAVLEGEAQQRPRERIAAADAELAEAFWNGASVVDLVHRRAEVVERILLERWLPRGLPELALVAVGGFGRGELFPRSDVDLLVLSEQPLTGAAAAQVEGFFAELWDEGLKPGHAVRTPGECREVAAEDITVATALMEARLLAGPRALFDRMRTLTDPPGVWPAPEYFRHKLDEQAARHARFDDTAYNLEPNLKEGPGGMRDLQVVLWLARRHAGVRDLEGLAQAGLIGGTELTALLAAREILWRARFGLHLLAPRAEERLLFEYQRTLAQRFGMRDEHAQNLAVEQFMQVYYRAAMTVDRLNERLVQALEESLGSLQERALDEEFVAFGGHLDLRRPAELERDPGMLLRAFLRLAGDPALVGFRSRLLAQLDEALPRLDPWLRGSAAAGAAFLRILRHPGAVADTLQKMGRYGVLGRILPAFGHVAGRMQHDLFHVYTVDQHTLKVLGFIQRFGEPAATVDYPLAHDLFPRLRKPELLYLAGLFHDIAKGRGGDHSELGEAEAASFCARLALSPADSELVCWLVREHLVMSTTAQKQDLGDPEVVRRFAARVGDRERLDYLYLLTVADINGTSPKLWNSWKDRLLADLYQATRYALRRGAEYSVHAAERVAETRGEAMRLLLAAGHAAGEIEAAWSEFLDDTFLRYSAEQIAWLTGVILAADGEALPLVEVRRSVSRGTTEVFVFSADRDGLFATLTATLDRFGLNVVEARVLNTRRGHAFDVFQVLEPDGRPIATAERERELAQRMRRELAREPLDLRPAQRAMSRQQRQFSVPTRLEFSRAEGGDRTQLALICADRPGLLAHVAHAFRVCRVRVHDARIATFGERVEDFFLLSDEHDAALDAELERCVTEEVQSEIDRGHTSLHPRTGTISDAQA